MAWLNAALLLLCSVWSIQRSIWWDLDRLDLALPMQLVFSFTVVFSCVVELTRLRRGRVCAQLCLIALACSSCSGAAFVEHQELDAGVDGAAEHQELDSGVDGAAEHQELDAGIHVPVPLPTTCGKANPDGCPVGWGPCLQQGLCVCWSGAAGRDDYRECF